MVSTHTMDYIDAATSGTLSPHILPVMDLQRMLKHIADSLPPTLHLPVSPDDILHFYRYLHTHVLIENKQFLLLINVPIQDRSQQITIHEIITINIPQGKYSAHYDIKTNIWESPRMQPWQWNSPLTNFKSAEKQLVSFVASPHLSSHLQIHHLV